MAPKKTKPSVPPPPPTKLPPPPPPPPPPPSTDSDDDGDSSDEEEAIPLQTPAPPQPTTTDSEDESDPEEEESDDDKEEEPTTTTTTKLPKSDSEEEESDDDDDDEEPITTTTKHADVAAKPQTTLDESDSDEEEESDDEQPPTTKQAAAVVSETSKKRNLEEDNITTNSLGKKLKLSSPSTPTTTAMTNDKKEVDEGPSATPKKTIERLFTKQDEITLLEGILDYRKDVMNDIDAFYDHIHHSLQCDANQNQLKDKIIRMKKKYLNSIKKRANKGPGAAEPTFSQPHDHKSYQLSKRIWRASSASPPKQIPPSSAVDFGIVDADNDLLQSWVKLGVQGRDDLEERWKALQIKHLTLHVEKTKLSLEAAQLAFEAGCRIP